ncbi:MAG: two-component regulator propeller domain-containing protein [Bacteroidota bacterium]
MYYSRIFKYLLVVFLLQSLVSIAQAPFISEKSLEVNTNYVVETFNSENGLPQNTVMNIFQTNDGFLWIATFNGLIRYDGIALKLFNTLNTPGLPNNSIKNLVEDYDGILWLTTINGKLLKYDKGVFETIIINDNENIIVKDICVNEKSQLVVGTENNQLYKINDGHFSPFIKLPIDSIKLNKIQYNFPDGSLLIGTTNGLYQYKDQQLVLIPEIKGKVFQIKRSHDNKLWVSTGSALFRIKNGTYSEYELPEKVKEQGLITDFYADKNENVWVATKSGLNNLVNETVSFYNTTSGLSSNNLSVIYEDREENLWVGTSDAGVNKMKLKTFKSYSAKDGLLSDAVGAILKTKDNSILITNFCQGITQFKDIKYSRFNKPEVGCVWSLLEDSENNSWIGTYGNWLYRYKNGIYEHFPVNKNPANNIVFSMFQDNDGVIWIGTEAGLYTYKNGKFKTFGESSIIGTVRYITQDKKGRIWFCSKSGLGVIENEKVEIYTTKNGLSSNEVRYIYEDKEGIFWIATYGGGICRLKDDKFFAFNQSKNFIDDFTSCILEDDDDNFWVSTDHGIYSIKRNDLNKYADGESMFLNTIHYGKEDGLKNSECTGGFQPAGLKDSDGRLWFPTLAGVAIVDTKKISKANYNPELTIERILVDENKLFYTDSLFEISRNIKKIEFQYTAPIFTKSKNILFQYKLDGKDQEWSPPTKARFASYLGLGPGNYVFRVRIYGSMNTAINKEKSISFKIPFPFWKTIPFYIFISVLLVTIFLMFFYLRINNIRKKEAEKTEINKNYATLELKALQGQMNPHFIFNCLNSIKLFIATDNKIAANKYLLKFSKLIRLGLEHSSSPFIRLTESINLITLYVELEQLRVDHNFVFNLNIEPSLDIENIEIPSMLVQPFVENAIHHGLGLKGKDGILNLTFAKNGNILIIEVDDNGIGRKRSFEMKNILSENRKSIGISNTEERIKIINYIKNTNIKVRYVDKINPNNEPEGTLVYISIPLT